MTGTWGESDGRGACDLLSPYHTQFLPAPLDPQGTGGALLLPVATDGLWHGTEPPSAGTRASSRAR